MNNILIENSIDQFKPFTLIEMDKSVFEGRLIKKGMNSQGVATR